MKPVPIPVVKTAIIGASGFVGRHLFEVCRRTYPDCIGTSFSNSRPGLVPFDIRRPDLRPLRLVENGFKAVLIASAKPNIGYCEQNPAESHAINVSGMLELIRQVIDLGLQPIFLSSDYVFDGKTGGYADDAQTNPSTVYGKQKQAVEQELPRLTDNHLVIRLSKIYGERKGDNTLLDELASTLLSGKEFRAATNQTFSPTYVDDLVRCILAVQANGLRGTINICNPQPWNRYAVAMAVAEALGITSPKVAAISLHDLPGMGNRPLNTSMTCPRLQAEVAPVFSSLKDSIRRMAAQYKG